MEKNNNQHQKAIVVLILGILSIILVFAGKGVFIGIGCGIAAIILGLKAKKESANKEPMATAGFICGIIGTILSVIIFVLVVIGIIATTEIIKKSVDNNKKILDIYEKGKEELEKDNETDKSIDDGKSKIDEQIEEYYKDSEENDEAESNSEETNETEEKTIDKQKELEDKIAAKQKEIKELNAKINSLTIQYKDAVANNQTEKVSAIQSEINTLSAKVSAMVNEISTLNKELLELK